MDKKMFRSLLLLATFSILLVTAMMNLGILMSAFQVVLKILQPLFIGVGIAYILRKPYNFFLKNYQKALKKKMAKFSKPLAMLTVYAVFIGAIIAIVSFIVPQFSDSVSRLYANLNTYKDNIDKFSVWVTDYLNLAQLDLSSLDSTIQKIPSMVGSFISGLMPQLVNFTSAMVQNLINIILGLIISIYILSDKERLKRQATSMKKAYLPLNVQKKMDYVLPIADNTFTKFISGQSTEALILGSLCCLGMVIFNFEYPLMISVMIAVTSLIPVVGSIIGLVPSLFVLLMVAPVQALWFLLFILVLQQFEGNVIYPRVVGGSVGLPALWVLLAIIVGGGLFGILGMLMGVPVVSVIYQLTRNDVNVRLKSQKAQLKNR